MASYAFIEKDNNVEVKRLCATDASRPLRLIDGSSKAPAAVVAGDQIRAPGFVLRVDQVLVTA